MFHSELFLKQITLVRCHDTDGIMTLAYNPGKANLIASFGFRHYARNFAAGVGLTGFIQRIRYMDVKLVVEGTQAEIRQFETWLYICHGQGMFQQLVPEAAQPIFWRSFQNFTIQLDCTRPHHRQAHPDGIIRGTWSDNQNEKLSEHSAILYQGGRSRDSRDDRSSDRGSDRSSGGGYLSRGAGQDSSRFQAAGKSVVHDNKERL